MTDNQKQVNQGAEAQSSDVHKKSRIGVVKSSSMDKSITVLVERKLRHPIYGKYVKKSKKFMAHDQNNECNPGDLVRIEETRPLSKRKRFALVEVIEKAK